MLYRILIVCVTILLVCSKTTLSSSQCPSMFSLSDANITILTPEQMQSLSSSFFSLYDGQSLQENIQEIVIHQNSQTLNTYIMSKMIIYLIIAVIVTALAGLFCVCCLFDRSCPPDGLRRNTMKSPYSITEFRLVTAVTIVAALGVAIPVIIAFSYLPTLKLNVSYTTCSIYMSLDFILNGQANSGWGGFNNLYDKIGNVTNYLTQSIPAMNAYLIGNDWLVQTMQEMKQQNYEIYRNNKDALLISPNPSTTKIALDNNLPTPQIPSRFITSTLGPSSQSNSLIATINTSLSSLQVLSSQARSIQTSAVQIINSSPTILANTNSSRQSLEMYIVQLKRLVTQIDQVSQDYLNSAVDKMLIVLQTVFGLQLLLAFFALFGVFSVYCFEIFHCRVLVLWAWLGFAIMFTPIIAIVFFTHGVGSLGYGFCNYFDSMLHQQSSFNKIVYSDSQNPFNRLDVCMFGDGNVLQKFDLAEQMGTVTGLFSNMKTFYDYQNSFSTNYVDMSISTSKISSWMSVVHNLKTGIFMDYDQSATTDDNPNYAIKSLTNYTFKGGSFPTCSKDRWVFDSTNCTSPIEQQDKYITGTLLNGQSLATRKQSICISFNEKLADMMSSSWTENDFTARYTQIRQNCPGAYAQILTYGYAIINYRDSRQNLFQGIYDQLSILYSTNLQFNQNITTFQQSVIDFQSEISNLSNAVSNPLNGLLVSSDCRKIVDYLKFTQNMFCTNVMHDIIKIGWSSMIIAGFSLVALISGFFFSLWFTEVQKNHKLFFRDFSNDDQIQQSVIQMKKITQDVGEDFQKLAIGTGGKIKKTKTQQKKISYDSQESDEQNPYAKDMEL